MLERTAYRIYPIIKEICSKMVTKETEPVSEVDIDSDDSLDYK